MEPPTRPPHVWSRRDALRIGLGSLIAGSRALARDDPAPGDENPQGRIYTACAFELGAEYKAVAIDPATGTWTQLPDVPTCFRARVSRDGRRLAYEHEQALWIKDLERDDEPKKLAELERDASGSPPVWSPDGDRILLSLGTYNDARDHWDYVTFEFPLDGSEKRQLKLPITEGVMDWLPDGKTLLVNTTRWPRLGWQVALVRPDGTGFRPLTIRGNNWWPRISPDGRSVLYVDGRNVWVADLETKRYRRLLRTERGISPMPCWSPDGEEIAVLTWRLSGGEEQDSGNQVLILDRAGRELRAFPTPLGGRVEEPDWH
jgi:dipeptidyl aminopeptidase/acylaminoacyl peptidase